MRRRRRPSLGLPALAALAAAAALAVDESPAPRVAVEPAAPLAGAGSTHPQVAAGERRIVVLRTPSLAQRLAVARFATEAQERQWTAQALAAQQQVLGELAAHGLGVRPDYTFARVLDGFSAPLDPRAVALLERDPAVAGIYPVRAAFPASLSAPGAAAAVAGLAGADGRGVRIALLDTGVDAAQPALGGRVEPGIDLVDRHPTAAAQPDPQDPARVERHGTELAGLLVGAGGRSGLRGVAAGATVLPIRIAGWQPDARGRDVVYARSDQLVAGLDRAVDPNGDGDAHDAARIALVGVSEPYAAFADSPEARAVAGALALDTLVVAPAGDEGAPRLAGGSVGGPGGAPAALAVGALDTRPATGSVHLAVWRGLRLAFDGRLPLLGGAEPPRPLLLRVGLPRGDGEQASDYFDRGLSRVAGRAALVGAGADPGVAAAAGARAVLVAGGGAAAGALGLPGAVAVPVVSVPATAARALRAPGAAVALGGARSEANPGLGRLARFSSRGLAFGGEPKPDLVAPGVALATAEPGRAADGAPASAAASGTGAAAAVVAGSAAVLAALRPALTAPELASLLAGSAGPGGLLDVGASLAGELAASVTSLSLGRARSLVLTSVSSRRLVVGLAAGPSLRVRPRRVVLGPGRSARVRVVARARPGSSGTLVATPAGGQPLRIRWAVPAASPASLLRFATLDPARFAPSDTAPAVLAVGAGLVARGAIEPVLRLDVLLYSGAGAYEGVLARERDLLPGTYRFGITGRSPTGARLPPGRYELRLVAWPAGGGAPSRLTVRCTVQ